MRVLAESIGLIERGHRVTIVTAARHRLHQEARRQGVPVVDLPLHRKRLPDLMALRRWLAAHGEGIDIMNTHSSTDAWLTAVAGLTLRGAPPAIRTRHVSSPVSRRWGSRWIYQRAVRHLVTTGEALRQTLHAGTETGRQSARLMAEFALTGIELAGEFSARFAQVASGLLAGMADALQQRKTPDK